MANLADIVEALLEQIARAQAAADAKSATIGALYAGNSVMRRFPPPRPVIHGVSLELKVAFRSPGSAQVGLTEAERADLLQRIAGEARGAAAHPAVAPRFAGDPDLRSRWDQAAREMEEKIGPLFPVNTPLDAPSVSADAAGLITDALSDVLAAEPVRAPDEKLRDLASALEADIRRALAGAPADGGALPSAAQRKLSRIVWEVPFQRAVAAEFEARPALVEAWDQQAEDVLDRVQVELSSGAGPSPAARAARLVADAVEALLEPPDTAPPEGLTEEERGLLLDALTQAVQRAWKAVAGPSLAEGPHDYEVVVSSEELASIPAERISTLKLTILQPTGARGDAT